MNIVSAYLKPLQDDPISRPAKSKLRFIIYFIIIVAATISSCYIWKSHLQNPSTVAKIACSVTFDHTLCFTSISSLQRNISNYSSTANPSKIFVLSLHVSISELSKMTPFFATLISSSRSRWTVKTLRNCQDGFHDSGSVLNKSLALIGDDPNENFFREPNVSRYLKEKILHARDNIDKCKRRLFLAELYDEHKTESEVQNKMEKAWKYVDNSLQIFNNLDKIHTKLNPTIGSTVDFHYLTTVILGLSSYFFLAVLIFLVVKSMN